MSLFFLPSAVHQEAPSCRMWLPLTSDTSKRHVKNNGAQHMMGYRANNGTQHMMGYRACCYSLGLRMPLRPARCG